jgi:hypothetical protein
MVSIFSSFLGRYDRPCTVPKYLGHCQYSSVSVSSIRYTSVFETSLCVVLAGSGGHDDTRYSVRDNDFYGYLYAKFLVCPCPRHHSTPSIYHGWIFTRQYTPFSPQYGCTLTVTHMVRNRTRISIIWNHLSTIGNGRQYRTRSVQWSQ